MSKVDHEALKIVRFVLSFFRGKAYGEESSGFRFRKGYLVLGQ